MSREADKYKALIREHLSNMKGLPSEYKPYLALWAHVMVDAVCKKDIVYFQSPMFRLTCSLLGKDSHDIINELPPHIKEKVLNNV